MKRILFASLTLALLLGGAAARAQIIPGNPGPTGLPPALKNVGFDPQLNAQIPLDFPFRDEDAREVRLRDYAGTRPVVLVLVYYGCPMLCNQVEESLIGALKMISFNPGRDYDVVFVSFDPRESPDMAAQKKEHALARFARPQTASGWHFLTGTPESIAALTKAANFRYTFDEKTNLFAHASGIMMLTPDGRISRYFFGVDFPPNELRLGLMDASSGKIGTPTDHLVLFCYEYDPVSGTYSAAVLRILRAAGVLTFVVILFGIFIFRWREKRAARLHSQGAL